MVGLAASDRRAATSKDTSVPKLIRVTNWFEELKRLVPIP